MNINEKFGDMNLFSRFNGIFLEICINGSFNIDRRTFSVK